MPIGFRPALKTRTPYISRHGIKLAYLVHKNGFIFIQSLDGRIIAKILRFGEGFWPGEGSVSAEGSTLIEAEEIHEMRLPARSRP